VSDLLDSLGHCELDFWWARYQKQPWSSPEWQAGLICSTVANFAGKVSKQWIKTEVFVPRIIPEYTPQQIEQQFRLAFAAMGMPIPAA
jgi:hypothetical protein